VTTLARITGDLSELLSRTGAAAPAILFLASFVEHVFPPFPGDVLVVVGAWYVVHGHIPWPLALLAVTAGAVAGSLGRRLDARAARKGVLSAERLARFEAGYRRWGVLLLLANRFFPGVRAFIFVAAGACGIPLRTALFFGGLSAVVWAGLLLGAGALLARNADELVLLFDRYTEIAWIVLALAALAAGAVALRRRRSGRTAPEGR
jgi:membrane-associated protein